MAGTLASLFVQLGLRKGGFDKSLKGSVGTLKQAGKDFAKIGLGFGIAATAGGAVAGKALLNIATDFDSMSDSIRIGTGKTGNDLKGLEKTALNVFKSIPTSMELTGTALTELSRRTDATGTVLEGLTRTHLELARVTETDLAGNIESTAQAFKQWGVDTDAQVGKLDLLFRASQKTGVPIATLGNQLSSYGPILRQMGFGLDDSIALLGTLGKAGLDAGMVVTGMRTAFRTFADEGLTDTSKALQDVFTRIRNAPSDLAAGQLAIDTFGSRAGPALAESIRAGRLEYSELLDVVINGNDTILGAAKETNDLAENWQIFRNRMIVLVLPAAMKLFDFFNDTAIPALEKIADGVETLSTLFAVFHKRGLNPLSAGMRGFGDLLTKTNTRVGPLNRVIRLAGHTINSLAKSLNALLKGNHDSALRHLGMAFHFVWDGIRTAFNAIPWGRIATALWNGFRGAVDFLVTTAAPWVAGQAWGLLRGLWTGVDWAAAGAAIWAGVKDAVRTARNLAVAGASWLSQLGIGVLRGLWSLDWKAIGTDIWNGVWTAVQEVKRLGSIAIDAVIDLAGDLRDLRDDAGAWITTAINWVGDRTIDVGKLVLQSDVTIIDTTGAQVGGEEKGWKDKIVGFAKSIPDLMDDAVRGSEDLGRKFFHLSDWIVGKLVDGLIYAVENISVDNVKKIGMGIVGAFAGISLLQEFVTLPARLVSGFVSGIVKEFVKDKLSEPLRSWAGRIVATVKGAFGISSPSTVFASIGENLVAGLAIGIDRAWDRMMSWLTARFNALPVVLRKLWQISSPSKTFANIGAMAAKGLGLGFAAELPNAMAGVHGAVGNITTIAPRLAPMPALARSDGFRQAGGNRGPVTINLTVNGAGDPERMSKVVAKILSERLDRVQRGMA